MEDDFLICDGALDDMFRFIDVANSRGQRWMGVRASYGLNGIVLKMTDAVSLHAFIGIAGPTVVTIAVTFISPAFVRVMACQKNFLEAPRHSLYRVGCRGEQGVSCPVFFHVFVI